MLVSYQETCSSFPDITKPAKNPKLSAMIDAIIINNGESSEASAAPKKIYETKNTIPANKIEPEKLDYSRMIGPPTDEESPTFPIIPSAPKRKYPAKKKTRATKTEPRKLDYSKMIGPSSDEESQESP